jgi:hypothetical protein
LVYFIFDQVSDLDISYLPYSELEKNREPIVRFGFDLKAIRAIASVLDTLITINNGCAPGE